MKPKAFILSIEISLSDSVFMLNLKYIRLIKILLLFVAGLSFSYLHAQNDEAALLNGASEEPDYTFATFKSLRVINGHSVEMLKKKHLLFIIAHRFNRIDQGFYDIFGLDQATIRFGFDYGITDWFQIGMGRSTFQKTYDGYAKIRLLRQSTGSQKMPLTLSVLGGSYIRSERASAIEGVPTGGEFAFVNRLSYAGQVLIARKFSSRFSLQLMPTVIHRNYTFSPQDNNTIFSAGAGARFKISNRVAINGEYFYVPSGQITSRRFDAVSLGLDIETGGHVFQLHLTNTRSMTENGFIAGPNDDITDGGIYFGFNIVRTFSFDR